MSNTNVTALVSHNVSIAKLLWHPKSVALALVAATYSISPGIADSGTATDNNVALTATLQFSFRPTAQFLARSSVVISPLGLRVTEGNDESQINITNNKLQKYWRVDEHRSIVHEVPLTVLDDSTTITTIVLGFPGFVDTVPCLGAEGTLLGDIEYKGRMLESWRCDIDNAQADKDDEMLLPVSQYYSPELKLVIYSLSHEQIETELVDIAHKVVDPALFLPAAHLRPVTIEEYEGGPGSLEQYGNYKQ